MVVIKSAQLQSAINRNRAYRRGFREIEADNCEITLEANPGTVETGRFKDYVKAGMIL